jgi:hypothetical protein
MLVSYLGTDRHERHIKRHVFEEDNYGKWYGMLWNVMEPECLPTVQPATVTLSVTTSPTRPESPKSYPGVQPGADDNRLESVPLLD